MTTVRLIGGPFDMEFRGLDFAPPPVLRLPVPAHGWKSYLDVMNNAEGVRVVEYTRLPTRPVDYGIYVYKEPTP